jgi:uncharacterized repeat protein (TIGR01451 family)
MVAGMLCTLILSGCTSMHPSCIDPSGDRVFATPPPPKAADRSKEEFFEQPLGRLPWDDVAVELHPREIVAPVGSEVVLIAGVCGPDGYLRTNRRLEWSIDQGSVGQFVAVGDTGLVDLLVGDFNQPRKITSTYAIGSTLRTNTRLNRGTCRPEENVYVLRGQGWISLTSPAEGTSHVTVVAPEVYTWDARLRSSMVHWVDAQWRFPPPAINPAGSKHVFTTSVVRQTNQTPCERWRVRYEITGGPPAGFSPDGAQSVEVPTDSAGQASVEIFQKEPRHGVNQISIQVIRPGDLPGANGQRFVVGSGTTTKTWTGADLALRASGPAVASPSGTLAYRIDVSNPGDIAAKDVVLANAVPDGLTYLNSNPAAEASGQQLTWRLGELGARQSRTVSVNFRAERQGSVNNCFEVTAAGGLKASTCAATTITTASIDVRIDGPPQATVGTDARFTITIRNLSQAPATGLVIIDRLDQGLQNPAADQDPDHAIKRSLGDLAAGASQPLNVTLRVAKAGRLCHTVEVTGKGLTPVRTQACVMGVGGAAPPEGRPDVGPPPGGESPKPNVGPAAPSLTIKQAGPTKSLSVGEEALFTITILNTGATALKKVEVLNRSDIALTPLKATDGYLQPAGGGLAWMIDNLPAGEKATIAVLHSCQAAAGKACNRVTVKSADGAKAEDEACVEIREAARPEKPPVEKASGATLGGGLVLSVVGLHSPVAVGKQLTYEIRLKNEWSDSFRQVAVTATLPDGMTPVSLGTIGPDSTQHTRDGQTVRFDVVPEVKSGAILVYRVRALAKKPGRDFRIHVEATATDLPKPLVQEAMTEVIEKPEK